jgi:hypothetical protein
MSQKKVFVASDEAKGKAKQLRLFAFIAWIVAIAGQVYAIFNLISDEMLTPLIVAIVVILALAITGNLLWKKANKLDPASGKDKVKFFIQSKLGVFMSVLAFLPMVILILSNKEISGKTKGIAGVIAVIGMLVAGATGVDFNPPSIEQYTEEINKQTTELKELNFDNDNFYWTKAGNKYYIFEDCQHIKDRDVINSETVKESWEQKGISELCKTCKKKAVKARDEALELPQTKEVTEPVEEKVESEVETE